MIFDSKYQFLNKESTVIEERIINMTSRAEAFIDAQNYRDFIYLNKALLHSVVLDYFTDLARLKSFENIEFANKNKITAYMSYWWIRRKPLQIKENLTIDEKLVSVNENFIATLILKDMMEGRDPNAFLDHEQFRLLKTHLIYHLKYRALTPQSLELIIMSMKVGIDIGENIPPIV